MGTAWDSFRWPTDGPYPAGYVRVAGARMPMRVCVLRGVVVPIPWGPEQERPFQTWFRAFARSRGWPENPDHDRYSIDWRAAWFMGLRGIIDDDLRTTSGRVVREKLDTFKRTENKQVIVTTR